VITASPGHVQLVGLMGSGKTTVGRRLGAVLAREVVDVDALVERRCGSTIAEIFVARGEAAFRHLEAEVVAETLRRRQPLVVCFGGGAVLDAGSRQAMAAAGPVVWLKAPSTVLAERVGQDPARPLLGGDALGSLERLARQREPVYASLATVTVDTQGQSPDQTVDRIVDALKGAGSHA
jgi:shikimate kinase